MTQLKQPRWMGQQQWQGQPTKSLLTCCCSLLLALSTFPVHWRADSTAEGGTDSNQQCSGGGGAAEASGRASAAAVATPEVGEGPCSIERVRWEDLSAERFEAEYKERRPLIVVTGLAYNARLRAAVEREALLEEYGDMVVSLGTAESYHLPPPCLQSPCLLFCLSGCKQPWEPWLVRPRHSHPCRLRCAW